MNYIIMDLEWNQAVSGDKIVRCPAPLYGEIIQIGAVKTDEDFDLIDKIKINVRPKYYKKMNPYVEKITGVTEADLTRGEPFPAAYGRFLSWCGENFRVITWGFDDIATFSDNLMLHKMETGFGRDYINLQLIFNRQTAAEHLQCALSSAAEKLGVLIDVQVHDALGDAILTYEVLKRLDMTKGIADYAEMSANTVSVAVAKDYIEKVSAADSIISDGRVREACCPYCKKEMTLREWVFSSSKACRSIGNCPEHGDFLIKAKAVRTSDKHFTVTRSFFAASDEDKSAYEKKLAKRLEVLERRKKAKLKTEEKKDNNEKNGNV